MKSGVFESTPVDLSLTTEPMVSLMRERFYENRGFYERFLDKIIEIRLVDPV